MQKDPMKEWVLRDELLAAFHRWPRIVLFAGIGSLLGIVLAYLWPASYRASVELSVELNPYRVLEDEYIPEFAGVEFRNIDDYKHWQMLQLSIIVLSDPFMQETLTRLIEKDQVWSSTSPQDLREILSANWRNAGQWRLSATGSTAQQAAEAVETWSEVVIDLTGEAIASSRDLYRLELLMRSLNDQLLENQMQQAAQQEIQMDVNKSMDLLNSLRSDEVLSEADRLDLLATANHVTGYLPGGETMRKSFPQESVPVSEYALWFEGMNAVLARELKFIESRISELQEEISKVNTDWEEGLAKGSGLSATLNLANRQNNNTRLEEMRSYGLAVMVGALLGLFAWLLVLMVQISRKDYQ